MTTATVPAAKVKKEVATPMQQNQLLDAARKVLLAGIGAVALARMAIASGTGAAITLPVEAASWPQAALHGERVGRILVATRSGDAVGLAAQDADVAATRLGRATGSALTVELGGSSLRWTLEQLTERWEQAF